MTRLQIVTMVQRNREVSFHRLRDTLGLSDGNLGSHMQRLLEAGYIIQRRALIGVRFELRYRLSPTGREALERYVRELDALLGRSVDAAEVAGGTKDPGS